MSKFHVYHQHDSMQCGIACLQMICKYHGKEYSQDTLSRYCFATNEGVSLLGISEAATRLGLHTTCGRVTTEQLHKAPLPCILHWNQNHFVVLYRIKKGKIFYIADPGKGLVTYDNREFKEHWLSTRSNGEEKGIAMFLQPTPAFYKQQEETTKDKRSFRFLLGYLRQYRRYFGQIILGALVGCLLQLIFPHASDCRCGHRPSKSELYLPHPVGATGADHQSRFGRLYPPMDFAAYQYANQYFVGFRLFHQIA